jgi:hypothetical protein
VHCAIGFDSVFVTSRSIFRKIVEERSVTFRHLVQKNRFEVASAIAAAIVAVCGIFVVVTTLRMVILGWSPAPFWDQWDSLMSGRSLSWSWLVKQHNEHRIFLPRLIFWLDRWLAAETNIVDFVVNVLVQAALAALLFWLALKDSAANLATRIWAAGLCLALLFWAVQYENFLWGFQVQFFGVVLLAAAAFATVAEGPASSLGAGAAALLSGAAAYTLSSGVLVPGLALILGVWVRRPRWHLAVLLISAIGWPASYLWGYETPSQHSDPASLFSHFGAVIFHFLVQLGAPFFRALGGQQALVLAAVFGATGIVVFLAGLLLLVVRAARPSHKALATLAIYVLGATLLAAVGRIRFGAEQALSSRYSTPAIAFWMSTLFLWFGVSANRPRLRLATVLASLLLVIAAALSERQFAAEGIEWTMGRKLATAALLAGVADSSLRNLYPDAQRVLENRSLLLSSRTSVFAEDWTRLMGANFVEHFKADARCSGSFQHAEPAEEASSGWSAAGTAWREGSSEPLRRIVLVNEGGQIVGYGVGGFDASSIGETPNDRETEKPVWWIGDFVPADPRKVRAYAVDGGDHACLVGSNPRVRARPIALAPLPWLAPERAGYVDAVSMTDSVITIDGWGCLSGAESKVNIDTELPVRSETLTWKPRSDVAEALHNPALRNAGIEVQLALQSNVPKKGRYRLCVWTDDPKCGRRILNDAGATDGQPQFVCDATAGGPSGSRAAVLQATTRMAPTAGVNDPGPDR